MTRFVELTEVNLGGGVIFPRGHEKKVTINAGKVRSIHSVTHYFDGEQRELGYVCFSANSGLCTVELYDDLVLKICGNGPPR